ncbi:hypothetical protein B9Z55_006915 [Caenorhabditis nigoni]|nr:hypothetical protein B9Z55_006915 [Caenorhabditis nigoni]
MAKNEEGGADTRENSKTESPLNKNEILEKLKMLVAKTEKIENSQKRNFEEIAEKLQSMEESIPKFFRSNEDAQKNERSFKLVDGNLTVEAKVEITETAGLGKENFRKFDKSEKDFSDCILVVEDYEFYILKMYLAAHSPFFKTLFFGNFSESSQYEIRLNGIEPEDFQCFLQVLYGESAIDDSTVEGILLVADMYDSVTAIRRCEDYLLNESKMEFKKKLQISTQYRFEKLKNQCLSKINTIDDVRKFLPGDLSDLDSLILLTLFQKCVSSQ